MQETLAQVLRRVSRGHAEIPCIESAIDTLGAWGQRSAIEYSSDDLVRLVGRYARALEDVGVEAAYRLERELVLALGVAPDVPHLIRLERPVALVALRSSVRMAALYAGFDWSRGMQVQSTIAELARELGTMRDVGIAVGPNGASIEVVLELGSQAATRVESGRAAREVWIQALADQSTGSTCERWATGARLRFFVPADEHAS